MKSPKMLVNLTNVQLFTYSKFVKFELVWSLFGFSINSGFYRVDTLVPEL